MRLEKLIPGVGVEVCTLCTAPYSPYNPTYEEPRGHPRCLKHTRFGYYARPLLAALAMICDALFHLL